MTEQLQIEDLLRRMIADGASDLHVRVGVPPGLRTDGAIARQDDLGTMTPESARALVSQLLTEAQLERFDADGDLDFSHSVPGLARFRVNVLRERGSCGFVIRQIPEKIPTAEELDLPQVCLDLANKPRGLVLVTGPTGSGKSTTLAAMIDHINQTHHGHILTMEDPLEFVHEHKGCFVTHRQIGEDSASFAEGLRRALRQDPDVILIGEMRDLETISLAISAAETGHLVLGTLHTTSAISTVDRIIDVFPTEAQQQVRVQLATTLQGVISQCLLKREGGGRIAAQEVLVATDGVRSLVREGKTPQLLNLMQSGRGAGMCTLESKLIELVQRGLVAREAAIAKANRPDEVAKGCAAGGGRGHGVSPMSGSGVGRADPTGPESGMRRERRAIPASGERRGVLGRRRS